MQKTYKKEFICMGIIFLFISTMLSGCLQSPTYQGRQPIEYLSLSSDGSRLLSISGDHNIVGNKPIYDYIVWDTSSGEILWNETLMGVSQPILLSPNGKYLIKPENHSIYSINGEIIAEYTGQYLGWSDDRFFTEENSSIYVWDAINFTKIKTITFEGSENIISISPSMFAAIREKETPIISIIDISSENATYLWNMTLNRIKTPSWAKTPSLSWSKNGNRIQIIQFITSQESYKSQEYRLTIWNASDGKILYNTSFDFYRGKVGCNSLLYRTFGNYIIFDYDESLLKLYSLSGLEKTFDCSRLECFDWSYDKKIMAFGYEGIIEIRNATTWVLISTLKTPLYEYEIKGPIPFPSISYLLVGIVILALIIRRRKSIE